MKMGGRLAGLVKLFLLFTLYCHEKELGRNQECDIYILQHLLPNLTKISCKFGQMHSIQALSFLLLSAGRVATGWLHNVQDVVAGENRKK